MRLTSLKRLLAQTEADAYLITDVKNVYYFTGFRDISEASLNLLITLYDSPVLLVSPLSLTAAKENAKDCDIREIRSGERMLDKLVDTVRELKVRKVHFDKLPSQTYIDIIKRVDVEFVPNPSLTWTLRRVKDETELDSIRKAADIATLGIEAGIEVIQPGVREYEVAAEAEYAMRTEGSEGVSFETIVASGPRTAYPHGLCSDRVINLGDLVTIDLGATYSGYCSDLTRTIIVGEPSPKQRHLIDIVFRAQEEAFRKISAGAKARDIDASARQVFTEDSLEKYFVHGLGHGVGLDIHESPTLSPTSEDILEEGNVVTDEPGVYIEDFG